MVGIGLEEMGQDQEQFSPQNKVQGVTAWRALRNAAGKRLPLHLGIPGADGPIVWHEAGFAEVPSPVASEFEAHAPMIEGGADPFVIGAEVLCFYQWQANTYTFPSKVVSRMEAAAEDGADLLSLASPDSFYHFQRRRHARVRPLDEMHSTVAAVGTGLPDDMPRRFEGEIEDLSLGGARVRILRGRKHAAALFHEGVRIAATLPLISFAAAVPYYLLGQVRRVSGGEEAGSPVRLGVRWEPTEEPNLAILRDYLKQQEQNRLRRRAEIGASK